MGRFDEVEVYETLTRRWIGGYELADKPEDADGFVVRRQHDGSVVPVPIPADRIRPAHSAPPAS